MATFRNFLKHDWQVAFLYLVIAFSLYGWFLNNPFIMDDEIQVVENEHIHSLGNILAFFSSSTMGSGGAKSMGGVYYKPLLSTYYAIIWNFFGAQPAAYRAPTLTLFALSAFLIFLFSKRFFPKSDAELWSFFLGLLF